MIDLKIMRLVLTQYYTADPEGVPMPARACAEIFKRHKIAVLPDEYLRYVRYYVDCNDETRFLGRKKVK